MDNHQSLPIYLHCDAVDFRKSINGLALIIEQELDRSPFDPGLYLFSNKNRDKLKALYWDKTGFALWYKRLEKNRFKWPRKTDNKELNLSRQQLQWLLDGYEKVGAQLVGCMAHARRKFVEAEKAQKKGKTGKANWAINHLKKLYRIEKEIAGKENDERYRIRQAQAKPLIDDFKAWLDKSVNQVAPKTLLGVAIQYSLNQWDKLTRYLDDGRLSIDNNRAERAIKPFVIGRKNWMFSNTANGANASAILYSLIETAKANDLDPNKYITLLLTEIPKREEGDSIEDLMPWAVEV